MKTDKKTMDVMYEVVHMYGDKHSINGESFGHFKTLEEAKSEASNNKERYYENDEFCIYEMIWDDNEGEYVYQYDENGGLLDPVDVV